MTRIDYDAWHASRIERLRADDGWLTITGLDWLPAEPQRIGTTEDNDIIVSGGPEHLGTVALTSDGVRFTAAPGAEVLIDGVAAREAILRTDGAAPTWVRAGTLAFYALQRGDRHGLRIHDTGARSRKEFAGIERFPADPGWRILADWIALETPLELLVDSVIGITTPVTVTHRAEFTRDGERYSLLPTHGSTDAPMFVFRDGTSGAQTYGAARFLIGEVVGDGTIVLDFNKAINPPCALTPFATCPLPPAENILTLAVTAGERKPD